MNPLQQLSQLSEIVIDTGQLEAIAQWQPLDCTTNPSLILQAVQKTDCSDIIEQATESLKQQGVVVSSNGTQHGTQELIDNRYFSEALVDQLIVEFGSKISGMITGLVSSEVLASLSFDTQATVTKARQLIESYQRYGIGRERILIKIAATWEGINACRQLQQEGINCNMTLVFNTAQAVACAEAGATLISPFVGRILDWYKQHTGNEYDRYNDPGVQFVSDTWKIIKKRRHPTIIMAASFRNIGQILALAGCDKLTISPNLLQELSKHEESVEQQLMSTDIDVFKDDYPKNLTEADFRWLMNQDAMATEKLAEGIRAFHNDTNQLINILVGVQ